MATQLKEEIIIIIIIIIIMYVHKYMLMVVT